MTRTTSCRTLVLAAIALIGLAGAALADPDDPRDPAFQPDFYKGRTAFKNQEYQLAFAHWKRLAEGGHIRAQYWLGRLYYFGQGGIEKNDAEAAKWYKKAANQGHLEAMYKLARMHAFGFGVPQNGPAAIKWYRHAARRGHIKSILDMGRFHEEGYVVRKNEGKARVWYRKAARLGSHKGILRLARNLMGSTHAPRDYRRAYTWFLIAEAKGVPGVKATLRKLNRKFYDAEVARAKLWARDYLTRGKLPPRLKNEQ